MLASALKQRIQLQEKSVVQGPLGQIVTWQYVRDLFGRRIPVDVRTAAQYQQLNTQVSDKCIFRGAVQIELGKHRLLHRGKVFIPQASAKQYDGVTEIVVLEE